ncbi:MAG: hypothetical protein ACXVIJ_08270 [Thermoanaerobaculia bacterium]
MKASENDRVRTLVPVEADFSDAIVPAGTTGTVVDCYASPEGYAVDLAIPDDSLVGGFRYQNVVLRPDQFELIRGD